MIKLSDFQTPEYIYDMQGECLSGDCENGYGKIKYEEGSVYSGNFSKGLPNGKVLRLSLVDPVCPRLSDSS